MPPVIDTHNRTCDLNRDLEAARRGLSILEREESEHEAQQRAEYLSWIEQKAEKFRPPLEQMLHIFPMIQDLDDSWRRDVFRGQSPFNGETETCIRSLYATWLAYSHMFNEKAEYLARHGIILDLELEKLGRYKREADRVIRGWEPPVLSKAPSFRPKPLSEEGTVRFRQLSSRTIDGQG